VFWEGLIQLPLVSVVDPGCSLTRGWMSSSPCCTCRVHCSLRS